MPDVLTITPECIHVLLTQKGYASRFESLICVAVDEWYELLGSKRGALMELAPILHLPTKDILQNHLVSNFRAFTSRISNKRERKTIDTPAVLCEK